MKQLKLDVCVKDGLEKIIDFLKSHNIDSEYIVIYNVHNLDDVTFYRDNDPLMYGEHTYSTARETLSYSLEAVIDEYGESLPKENFSVCFENVSDIDDYVDGILCND